MLALDAYEAGLCPHCGNPPEVCRDPDADRNNPQARWMYTALPPYVCHVGTAVKVGETKYPHPDKATIPRVVRHRRGAPPQ